MNNHPLSAAARQTHRTLIVAFLIFLSPLLTEARDGINTTKHNLSVTGPGEIKAMTESRICIFCHTPHNAAPQTPLWNRSIKPISYILYSSTTMSATPSQPNGPSRLCLSCHDGTLALGAVLRPASGIIVSGQISAGRPSFLGTVLSGDHPFSFSYNDSVLNPLAGLSQTPPQNMTFYGHGNFIECSTCHDAHVDAFPSPDTHGALTGKFLVMDNRYSALCVNCHSTINGWSMTSHQTSLSTVNGVLPIAPKIWPAWLTVTEWGCEGCHTPHSAAGTQRLLRYREEERNCYACHNGTVVPKNIMAQFQNFSRHPVEATMGVHDPKESFLAGYSRHVECADCHNPHASNSRTAIAPNVSGRLEKVSGMTIDRAFIDPALYEYEVCLKCHADMTQQMPFIPRVLNNTNMQATFSQGNPSYHPVVGVGRNPNVPSIPSTYEPAMTSMSLIYCTDCHSDDSGVSRGPHGSRFAPILRFQYETTDGTQESAQNYALCYRCHNQTSILNDQSFSEHRLHIVDQKAPCSVCHDAHGILDDNISGSHTHLINFDTRYVFALAPNTVPLYQDTGNFTGSCTLICHGKTHNKLKYTPVAAPGVKSKKVPRTIRR